MQPSLAAFTLVELWVVIGIIVLLIAILLTALNKARQAAQPTACLATLHSILLDGHATPCYFWSCPNVPVLVK